MSIVIIIIIIATTVGSWIIIVDESRGASLIYVIARCIINVLQSRACKQIYADIASRAVQPVSDGAVELNV